MPLDDDDLLVVDDVSYSHLHGGVAHSHLHTADHHG